AAKLIGNEVADHRRSVSTGSGCNHRRAAGLLPLDHQGPTGKTAWRQPPACQDTAMTVGQRTILGGVSGQLMKNHRYWLSGLCGENELGPFNVRAHVFGAESQLAPHEFAETYTLPTAATE